MIPGVGTDNCILKEDWFKKTLYPSEFLSSQTVLQNWIKNYKHGEAKSQKVEKKYQQIIFSFKSLAWARLSLFDAIFIPV